MILPLRTDREEPVFTQYVDLIIAFFPISNTWGINVFITDHNSKVKYYLRFVKNNVKPTITGCHSQKH